MKEELNQLKNSGFHGLINLKGVNISEIVEFAPIVLIVKTEDKNLLKKKNYSSDGNKSYSSLLR